MFVFVKYVPLRKDDKDLRSPPILDPTETVDEDPTPTEIAEDAPTPLPLEPTETVDKEPAHTEIPEDATKPLPIDPVDDL